MACSSTAMGDNNTRAVIVYVTVPSEEIGEKIAGMLVNPEARLAACVNIVPGTAVDSYLPSLVQQASGTLYHCCLCQGCSLPPRVRLCNEACCIPDGNCHAGTMQAHS